MITASILLIVGLGALWCFVILHQIPPTFKNGLIMGTAIVCLSMGSAKLAESSDKSGGCKEAGTDTTQTAGVLEAPVVYTMESKTTTDDDIEDLMDAIEFVESGCNENAVGDNGAAVGAYQLHTIYVDDVNRIIGVDFFQHNDRTNWWYSRIMTGIYLKHYGGTLEEMARKHNGGPTGHLKDATIPYWEKVKARMKRQTLSVEVGR